MRFPFPSRTDTGDGDRGKKLIAFGAYRLVGTGNKVGQQGKRREAWNENESCDERKMVLRCTNESLVKAEGSCEQGMQTGQRHRPVHKHPAGAWAGTAEIVQQCSSSRPRVWSIELRAKSLE